MTGNRPQFGRHGRPGPLIAHGYLTYVFAMAATVRENYYGLNAVLAAPCRRLHERRPLIELLHTGLPFASAEWVGTVVVSSAEGKPITSEQLDGYIVVRHRPEGSDAWVERRVIKALAAKAAPASRFATAETMEYQTPLEPTAANTPMSRTSPVS